MSSVLIVASICWLSWRAALWAVRVTDPEPPPVREYRYARHALGEAVNRCKH